MVLINENIGFTSEQHQSDATFVRKPPTEGAAFIGGVSAWTRSFVAVGCHPSEIIL